MKTNNNYLFVLLFLLSLICCCSMVGQPSMPSVSLYIFADKSMELDTNTQKKVNTFLKRKLFSFLEGGDKQVHVSYIFEKSASLANGFDRSYSEVSLSDDHLEGNALRREKLKVKNKNTQLRGQIIFDVLKYLKAETRVADSSAILSCFKQLTTAKSKQIQVVIISDMMQNSKHIRNLYRTPLTSSSVAKKYAQKDVKKLQELFDVEKLKSKDITVLCKIPLSAMQIKDTNEFLQIYWLEVFPLLGIDAGKVEFSTLN